MNFTSNVRGLAWTTFLGWSGGSAAMGYGNDPTNPGIGVGGECFQGSLASPLTTQKLIGQWLTANITLYAPTQTMYFSIYDSNSALIGQTSSQGSCGTMFGTQPVDVVFFTDNGQADVDWISLTS